MKRLGLSMVTALVVAVAPAAAAQARTTATCTLSGGEARCAGIVADYTVLGGTYELTGECRTSRLTLRLRPWLAWEPQVMPVRGRLRISGGLVEGRAEFAGEQISITGAGGRNSLTLALGTRR